MNEDLVADKLQTHEKRIDNHAERIDNIEKREAARDVKIDNLCEKLENQTKSINILVGTLASALIGFFFYAVQTGLFK
jgi:enoyl-[acyl-carrier-protein] reductase (NADH)